MALSFRPIHLIWLLILLIILETAVLYLKHPDTFEHVIPAHLHNYYSGRYPHNHSHSKGGKHSHSSGHDLHFHGERPTFGMHVARREAGAPRVAIVTLQKLSSQRHGGIPSNVKKYAQHWKYDLIDASKSVSTAAKALRSGGGDPSFLRAFAIIRFLPQYDWVFWHDADSVFLNFSRSLDSYLDDKYDMILTVAPCDQGITKDTHFSDPKSESARHRGGLEILDTGHMLVQNTKTALNIFRSIWGMWNHSHCKYGDDMRLSPGEPVLCAAGKGSSSSVDGGTARVTNKAQYHGGDQGALIALLSNCEVCAEKVKFTGFRTFNSLYPCQGQGDLVVRLPYTTNATRRRAIAGAFLKHVHFENGTYDASDDPLFAKACTQPGAHTCSTRAQCDKLYHGLNKHGRCPHGVGGGKSEAANARGSNARGIAGAGDSETDEKARSGGERKHKRAATDSSGHGINRISKKR